jgi:hypothetical protein
MLTIMRSPTGSVLLKLWFVVDETASTSCPARSEEQASYGMFRFSPNHIRPQSEFFWVSQGCVAVTG